MAKKRKGERPDGLIQVSLQIGFRADGKPNRKYFYGHSRAEAERKREAYKQRIGSAFSPNITVREWVAVFKKTYRTGVDDAYLDQDDVPYNRLVSALGWKRMADVRESDLQTALNAVSGMSFSTVDKYVQCIRRVFLRAKKNKIISDNPADDLIVPPSTKGTHRALEQWETELILDNWNNPNTCAGLWVLLMMLCGLRRGEMMGLDWEAVDLSARTLSVRQVAVIDGNRTHIVERAKSAAGIRVLPICRALYDALCSVPEAKRFGPVCRSAKGLPLSETAVRRGLQQFCAVLTRIKNGESPEKPVRLSKAAKAAQDKFRASEDYVHFSFRAHDLRHTFATALYDAGVDVKAAQYFLGHSDVRLTMDLYTHLSQERDAASRKQMVSLFDSWVSERMGDAGSLPSPEEWTLAVTHGVPPEIPQK